MSQKYKTPLDDFINREKQEGDIVSTRKTEDNQKIFPCVNFIWDDGTQRAFSYSYMMDVSFTLTESQNQITANFTSAKVLIKGFGMYSFYLGMINHTVSRIVQSEGRYEALNDNNEPVINEIIVNDKD